MNIMKDIEPKNVFHWFYEISQIPRGSGNEKSISNFLVKFAKERNLEVFQDSAMNVIIKKGGTKGYENCPSIILQGHMDMVCEKTSSSTHNFLKDPIEFVVKDDMLFANNTTLGGDDGIAVAYSLAILDSNEIEHPPLEVLITTEEETGMGGAMALSGEHLTGKYLLNIDSEEEGVFLVSCAGGANANIFFTPETEPVKNSIIKISVSGLLGGHSGMEIKNQRANALKILSRVLNKIRLQENINIVEIYGGSKHNAIAKEAYAFISVEKTDEVLKIVKNTEIEIKNEYRTTDKDLTISAESVKSENKIMYSQSFTKRLIDFMLIVPDGVRYYSFEIPGLVQTSLNNGILQNDNGKIKFTISVRSSVKTALDETLEILKTSAELCGGEFIKVSEYPAWEYSPDSVVRETAVKVYEKLTGTSPVITAIHAGLECGLLKKTLPKIDAVSFGPNLYDVHTPNEHMEIASVKRVWDFLLAFLKELK